MARETKEVEQRGIRSSTASGRGPVWGSVLFLSGALLLAGCPKRPEVQTGAVRAAEEKVVIGEKEIVVVEEASLNDVFFDFDKSLIRSDAKVALGNDIKWLKANAGVRIVVEGHADERGPTSTTWRSGIAGSKRSETTWWRGALMPSGSQRSVTVRSGPLSLGMMNLRGNGIAEDTLSWRNNAFPFPVDLR